MDYKFNTIDDFDFEGKTVLLRVDINSPVDPLSGDLLDDTRLVLHSKTIKELSEKGAKVVILAHQSRPGKSDFTPLKQHALALSNILGKEVQYVDSIFSRQAQDIIKNMVNGEIALLENVRFYSEEMPKLTPEEQSNTYMVKTLAPLADYFVNDAFATAHRSQTSIIGFAKVLPAVAGRVMELELNSLYGILDNAKEPRVYVLGGIKADDSINVMANALKTDSADYILTTGLVANIFLVAKGIDLKEYNYNFIIERGFEEYIDIAKDLLKDYSDKIILPVDLAILEDDKRVEYPIDNIPNLPIYDIGSKTIEIYNQKILLAKTLFANGPAGVFEKEGFELGTESLLNTMAESKGFSIIGGGHLAAAASNMDLDDDITHISSGGGASINLIAGEELPAVKALIDSAKLNKN
ncbi:phosphoglycerate kinase [Methanosphaera sp. Vir-13MRS]|uniref:phosphoglycerate kinase n=1 Tax=Candidatus Methanosphaera massiliense TaxID=3017187 RepID=UPI00237FF4FF|nr:phosphoglycerate kinase [Candidatus Methanosphaera massiliense]MDE4077775.1 phosphoglycerate kinase [Candidatus Methanosphaera massiliense]MDY2744786.1 phosphoglycerate kinase [Methanosphaera sp.]